MRSTLLIVLLAALALAVCAETDFMSAVAEAGGDCHPECRWQCDDPVCPAVCHPVCERPKCQIHCEEVRTVSERDAFPARQSGCCKR